jgi:hypothetical protein
MNKLKKEISNLSNVAKCIYSICEATNERKEHTRVEILKVLPIQPHNTDMLYILHL